ncbi:hypothetical protein FP026_28195 [Rhizobium tropici]|uniref:Uncharacterized protein n=1 Tax=Rhizobium tropici TaxID=398 RepID=A0A5B0VRK4_RHITR|nr:hypothetical protein [Rhizobium tropici]KAA1176521.1 hypothetical protein FP026_28195 [Rhizobium tropici]
MINSDPPVSDPQVSEEKRIEAIIVARPRGALALAGLTTALVVAMWILFYVLVFASRGGQP